MGNDIIKLGTNGNTPPVIGPAAPIPMPMIKLTIVLDPATGRMNIHGPIHDKRLCAEMLFNAGYTIMNQKLTQQTPPEGNS